MIAIVDQDVAGAESAVRRSPADPWAAGLEDARRGERGGRERVCAGQPPSLWPQRGERDHREGMTGIDNRPGTQQALAGVPVDDDRLEQVLQTFQ